MTSKWHDTTLFTALQKRVKKSSKGMAAQHVVQKLELVMPEIETVLAKGSTAPTDFTLHDDDHGRRVAERIAEIAGPVLNDLSSAELALLLLAAYLHDIGMTPEQGVVHRHRQYLLWGDKVPLSEDETERLQTWLDETSGGIVPPLLKDASDVEALNRADLLLTHYSRSRHNDWSEEWIRKHLRSSDRHLYAGYLEDLVRLCRSHHEGYEELIEDRFDPRPVQYAGTTELVHLRYLAALLRLGDILEFDPERTPEIVFRHRAVSDGSTIYWYKDHDAVLTRNNDVLTFSGRPKSAAILHALETMADDIDRELEVCWRLDQEGRFSLAPHAREHGPHKWPLTQQLKRDIRPRDDSFEVFEGRFRPKTRRLLELLSGTQLYGTNLAAVRELVQNAFDAVRQRIAYQRLARIDEGLADDADAITANHHVAITVRQEDGRWILECRDTGLGMTKAIIRDRFLATGSRPGHRELDLERRCRAHSFATGRTGQFGIGSISYFMIANTLRITTRRAQEAQDDEAVTWQFTTNDLDDVGELRKVAPAQVGTTVRLTLNSEVTAKIDEWLADLERYLRHKVVRTPCAFTLRLANDSPVISWQAGWTVTNDAMREQIVDDLIRELRSYDDSDMERLSSARRRTLADHNTEVAAVRNELDATLKILTREGDLPDRLGRYRVHLPFFNLRMGVSLSYLSFRDKGGKTCVVPTAGKAYLTPGRTPSMSWNGILVAASARDEKLLSLNPLNEAPFLEIDWASGEVAELAVNRDKLSLSSRAKAAIEFVKEEAKRFCREWVQSTASSSFAAANSRSLDVATPVEAPLFWTFWSPADEAHEIRQVRFPAVDLTQFGFRAPTRKLLWVDAAIDSLAAFAHPPRYLSTNMISWAFRHDSPSHVAEWRDKENHGVHLVSVWEQSGRSSTYGAFPREWRTVAASTMEGVIDSITMWNRDHPVAMAATAEGISWCAQQLEQQAHPGAHRHDLLSTRERASSWLMHILTSDATEMWEGLAEQDPAFIDEVWGLAFGDDDRRDAPLLFVQSQASELYVVTPRDWRVIPTGDLAEFRKFLPDPGPEWTIHEVED